MYSVKLTYREPIVSKPHPSHPFAEIAIDFCYYGGHCYLVIMDCYTDWPTVAPMGKSVNAAALTMVLRELFSRTAVPDLFWSDGGPQFTSKKFQDFAVQWGFKHQVSSPHYPQSNGKAEATVKSMKRLYVLPGMSDTWMGISSVRHCCSTATRHHCEMGYFQLRSSSGIESKTHSQPIPSHLTHNGKPT